MVPPSQYSVTSKERDLSKPCEGLGVGVVCKALGSRRPPNQTSFRMPPKVSLWQARHSQHVCSTFVWLLIHSFNYPFWGKGSSYELANLSMCSTFSSAALPICYLVLSVTLYPLVSQGLSSQVLTLACLPGVWDTRYCERLSKCSFPRPQFHCLGKQFSK